MQFFVRQKKDFYFHLEIFVRKKTSSNYITKEKKTSRRNKTWVQKCFFFATMKINKEFNDDWHGPAQNFPQELFSRG